MAAFVLFGMLLLADVLDQREQVRDFEDALRVVGTVGATYDGGADVPVRYSNAVTDQTIDVHAYVWRVPLPKAGASVRLEVNRLDPGDVRLAGDRFTLRENLPTNVVFPLIGLTAMGLRALGVVRTRRLLRSEGTAFAMAAALTPPWRLGRTCLLHLYAVDAPAGAAAVCSVPVVSTAGHPVPSGVFPVVVRGIPRPGGRVVVRAGGLDGPVLWPASRALLTSKVRRPPFAEPPGPVALDVVADPLEPRRRAWVRVPIGQVLVLVLPALVPTFFAALLVLAVAAITMSGQRASEAAASHAEPVIAQVVEADDLETFVVVSYRDPGSSGVRRGRAPVDYPEDYPVGRRYPALVSGDGIRLAREPYDAEEPIAWAVSPLVVAAIFLSRRVLRLRANLRALSVGPFSRGSAWVLPVAGYWTRVGVGLSGRGLRAVAKVHSGTISSGVVVVAGDAEPGAPIAFVVDGRAVLPIGPALSPRWPPNRSMYVAPPPPPG